MKTMKIIDHQTGDVIDASVQMFRIFADGRILAKVEIPDCGYIWVIKYDNMQFTQADWQIPVWLRDVANWISQDGDFAIMLDRLKPMILA